MTVTGQSFSKAIRVDTDKKPQEWMTHLQSFTSEKIHKGDVLYVTAFVRAVRIQDGKDAGVGRLYASEERGGNQHDSDGLYAGDFAVPKAWTRVHFPLVATRDFGPDDQLKLMFTFGQTAQVVEIGGIAALDFGPGIDKPPCPTPPYPWTTRAAHRTPPGAQAAQARIEKYRKGDLQSHRHGRGGATGPGRRRPGHHDAPCLPLGIVHAGRDAAGPERQALERRLPAHGGRVGRGQEDAARDVPAPVQRHDPERHLGHLGWGGRPHLPRRHPGRAALVQRQRHPGAELAGGLPQPGVHRPDRRQNTDDERARAGIQKGRGRLDQRTVVAAAGRSPVFGGDRQRDRGPPAVHGRAGPGRRGGLVQDGAGGQPQDRPRDQRAVFAGPGKRSDWKAGARPGRRPTACNITTT